MSKSFSLKEWANSTIINSEHSAVFAEQIEPLANQLSDLCRQLNVPMCVTFSLGQNAYGEDTHVMQALPDDPAFVGVAMMKVLVTANQMEIPLEQIEHLASIRALRSGLAPVDSDKCSRH